jgi:hypothetical protein
VTRSSRPVFQESTTQKCVEAYADLNRRVSGSDEARRLVVVAKSSVESCPDFKMLVAS